MSGDEDRLLKGCFNSLDFYSVSNETLFRKNEETLEISLEFLDINTQECSSYYSFFRYSIGIRKIRKDSCFMSRSYDDLDIIVSFLILFLN